MARFKIVLGAAAGLFAVIAIVVALIVGGWASETAAPSEPARDQLVGEVSRLTTPRVVWVRTSFGTTDSKGVVRTELRLEDTAVVTVATAAPADGKDGEALTAWATAIESPVAASERLRKLVPFLNGIALKATYPTSVELVPRSESDPRIEVVRLHYRLTRSESTRDAWITLLGRPGTNGAHRLVPFTVGFESGHMLNSDFSEPIEDSADGTQVQLMVVSSWWPGIAVAMVAVLTWFIYLARTTDILRDRSSAPTGPKAPYSLARVQMAVWAFLVVGAFLLIWMVTRERGDLPSSVLILVGLSSATTVGAMVVDNNRRAQRRDLLAQQLALASRIAKLREDISLAEGDAAAALRTELQTADTTKASVDAQLKQLPNDTSLSEGFFVDILNDGSGVSLHRLQIVIWTAVLAMVFMVTAWRDLAMPVFSDGLLALMGISAGTYLGFKGTERDGPAPNTTPSP